MNNFLKFVGIGILLLVFLYVKWWLFAIVLFIIGVYLGILAVFNKIFKDISEDEDEDGEFYW